MIIYNEEKKDLPIEQLHRLFMLVGWSDGKEDEFLKTRFNYPFINSTIVISAWDNDRLVGTVRVLSDKTVRSEIYDLVVDPKYQKQGIGKELLSRCMKCFPNTEWFVRTNNEDKDFYKKMGFKDNDTVCLKISSKYFD